MFLNVTRTKVTGNQAEMYPTTCRHSLTSNKQTKTSVTSPYLRSLGLVIKFHNTALMDFLYVSRDKNVLGAIRMATNYDIHTEVKIEPYKVL